MLTKIQSLCSQVSNCLAKGDKYYLTNYKVLSLTGINNEGKLFSLWSAKPKGQRGFPNIRIHIYVYVIYMCTYRYMSIYRIYICLYINICVYACTIYIFNVYLYMCVYTHIL